MLLRNKSQKRIRFDKGIDAWNMLSTEGSGGLGVYDRSHPFNLRPAPEGFVDDIVNLLFDAEGNLVGRHGVEPQFMLPSDRPNNSRSEDIVLLTHRLSSLFAFGVFPTGGGTAWKIYRQTPTSATPSSGPTLTFTQSLSYVRAVHYNTDWYFFPGNAAVNGSIKMTDASSATTTFTWNSPVPPATMTGAAFVWKDRVWVDALEYVAWSKATDPTDWNTPNGGYFKIDERISDMTVLNDTLYILTVSNAVWAFTYNEDPALDGYLRQIIAPGAIPGGGQGGPHGSGNIVIHKNELYVTGSTNIWRIVNNRPIAIADQLHLDLNQYTMMNLWNAGKYLILRTNYSQGPEPYNDKIYFYDSDANAWTRFVVGWYPPEGESRYQTYLKNGHFDQQDDPETAFIFFLGGARYMSAPNAFQQPYRLPLNRGFTDINPVDSILDEFAGSATLYTNYVLQRNIKHKLQTSVIYPSGPNAWHRFLYFVMDAYLAWRQRGTDSVDESPWQTTVEYVPTNLTDPVDTSIVKPTESSTTETPFVILANQRARGVRLTFDTVDNVFWDTNPTFSDATDNIDARPIIMGLDLIYTELERSRFRPGSTQKVDANVY